MAKRRLRFLIQVDTHRHIHTCRYQLMTLRMLAECFEAVSDVVFYRLHSMWSLPAQKRIPNYDPRSERSIVGALKDMGARRLPTT